MGEAVPKDCPVMDLLTKVRMTGSGFEADCFLPRRIYNTVANYRVNEGFTSI
jgi:hypothetical protein